MTACAFTQFVEARLLGTQGDRLQVWREAEEAFPHQQGVWSRVCRIARHIEADNCEAGAPTPSINQPLKSLLPALPSIAKKETSKPAAKKRSPRRPKNEPAESDPSADEGPGVPPEGEYAPADS